MLEERMSRLESALSERNTNTQLKQRIGTLERENKALQNYAKRLEETVKKMITEQRKKRDKYSRGLQTDPPVVSLL